MLELCSSRVAYEDAKWLITANFSLTVEMGLGFGFQLNVSSLHATFYAASIGLFYPPSALRSCNPNSLQEEEKRKEEIYRL
jgi:hypothetical protein